MKTLVGLILVLFILLFTGCDVLNGKEELVRKQMVVFASGRGAGETMNVWMMNPDGTGSRQVTHYTEGYYWPVDISPDGKRLLFYRLDDFTPKAGMYLMDFDGPEPQEPLVEGWARDGSFFPDGNRIIYEAGGTFRIFDLRDSSIVTADPDIDRSAWPNLYLIDPEVSPDGSTVCFTLESRADGPGEITTDVIFLMDPDGSNPRPITPVEDFVVARYCSFSPDGKEIVFSMNVQSHYYNLYRMDLASGEVHPVSQYIRPGTVDYHANATFDTSGTRIFFRGWGSHFPENESEILAIDEDGENLKRLTDDEFIDEIPVVGIVEFQE